MKSQEYQMIQNAITVAGGLVEYLDLDGFIEANLKADTLGVILDPTLWKNGNEAMAKIKNLAVAAKKIQLAFKDLQESQK